MAKEHASKESQPVEHWLNSEKLFFICAALVLIVMGVSIPWSVSWHYTSITKTAIEAGMEQRTLPGQTGVHWVKPESPK